MMSSVTLTAYNMGDVTEEEFDRWANYVSDNIDERCGFKVLVEQGPFNGNGVLFADEILAPTVEMKEAIREAIAALWEEAEW
jgi:hypothetical protein